MRMFIYDNIDELDDYNDEELKTLYSQLMFEWHLNIGTEYAPEIMKSIKDVEEEFSSRNIRL